MVSRGRVAPLLLSLLILMPLLVTRPEIIVNLFFIKPGPLRLGLLINLDLFTKGVFGCNLELFQFDINPYFHRRQLIDN